MADLDSLAAREFAPKFDVDVNLVFDWRLKICGRSAREIGWWRKARIRKLPLSGLSLSQLGKKLDISTSQAKRPRDKAKQDSRGAARGEGRRPDQSPSAA